MNYLAHMYFADRTSLSLYGNLLGDFIKGDVSGRFPPELVAGIIQHRKIDRFTDAHPTTSAGKKLFSNELYRFSGIIIDVCYDYFLTKHWDKFSTVELAEFIDSSYMLLKKEPDGIDGYALKQLRKMREENWISSYASLDGIDKVFQRLSSRLKRKNPLDSAIKPVINNYPALERQFLLFFPELTAFIPSPFGRESG